VRINFPFREQRWLRALATCSACSRVYPRRRCAIFFLFSSLFSTAFLKFEYLDYQFGNPMNWPFDHWIHQSPNVVIASVYYRLNSIGFLSVPEFSDSAYGDFNAGFQDQIQALRWINQYISAFGGDPSKVTINGQSAGASSVVLHMVARETEQLFSQAIPQSVYRTPLPTPEQQRVRDIHHL